MRAIAKRTGTARWRGATLAAGGALAIAAAAAVGLAVIGGSPVAAGLSVTRLSLTAPLPLIRGRPESCVVCHADVRGVEAAHAPEVIGCAACHGGNPRSRSATGAHVSLVRIPGNLENALQTCGQAGCHEAIVPRVSRSIMSTLAGMIAVDRAAFGAPAGDMPHVLDLGHDAADSHLRQLCASCHLGQTKDAWGPLTESSRGGGCNACHLGYTPVAARQLAAYTAQPAATRLAVPSVHPTLTIHVDGTHCFGCHSRSSRISTNFEGWHELAVPPAAPDLVSLPGIPARHRRLEDGRYFVRVRADVHQERGLDCIDCHPASEVMGRGAVVHSKADQVAVRCEDCHARTPAAAPIPADPEAVLLLGLRDWIPPKCSRLRATTAGDVLVGVSIDASGRGSQRLKGTGKMLNLLSPAATCERNAHRRLACSACHTAWAPRCVSCHTTFDPKADAYDHLDRRFVHGAWEETTETFDAVPPTLGVRCDARAAAEGRIVDTFIPGMIAEIDRNRDPLWPPDVVVRRWYARTAAHTTTRSVRSCASCHNDPVALGYGQGTLRLITTGRTAAVRFTPNAERLADGLPADAWVGFLATRTAGATARGDARPFTGEEQVRILRVGVCLGCHDGSSEPMVQALDDFAAVLGRRSAACVDLGPDLVAAAGTQAVSRIPDQASALTGPDGSNRR